VICFEVMFYVRSGRFAPNRSSPSVRPVLTATIKMVIGTHWVAGWVDQILWILWRQDKSY